MTLLFLTQLPLRAPRRGRLRASAATSVLALILMGKAADAQTAQSATDLGVRVTPDAAASGAAEQRQRTLPRLDLRVSRRIETRITRTTSLMSLSDLSVTRPSDLIRQQTTCVDPVCKGR